MTSIDSIIASLRTAVGHLHQAVTHVVAARMRRPDAPKDVTLVVNQWPCDKGRYACDPMLPHLLKPGSRLTVFVKDPAAPNGVRYHRTYRGTGRAVAP